jgi:hypothetical protein
MLRGADLIRTGVSEERIASIGKVTKIGAKKLLLLLLIAVSNAPILVTLMMEAMFSSETSVLIKATWRNIPKYGILHSHRRENLKSYINL